MATRERVHTATWTIDTESLPALFHPPWKEPVPPLVGQLQRLLLQGLLEISLLTLVGSVCSKLHGPHITSRYDLSYPLWSRILQHPGHAGVWPKQCAHLKTRQ